MVLRPVTVAPRLTPKGGGGMCIADSALEPADIIVSTTSAGVSKVIRAATNSPVSHAILYEGDSQVIEAIQQGVVRRSLDDALEEATLAVAYRRKDMTAAAASRIISYGRTWVGRRYDVGGAVGGGMRANLVLCLVFGIVPCAAARAGAFNSKDRFYCSELVLAAYRLAGVPIVDVSPHVSNPQQIVEAHSHGKLQYVGHLKA